MQSYLVCDTDGLIIQTGNGYDGVIDDQQGIFPGKILLEGEADLKADYVDLSGTEPVVAPRPPIAHGWSSLAAAPMTLDMGGLPPGTSVTAANEAGQTATTSDPADPIVLADAETYIVQIDPPWPYLPQTLTIEVT